MNRIRQFFRNLWRLTHGDVVIAAKGFTFVGATGTVTINSMRDGGEGQTGTVGYTIPPKTPGGATAKASTFGFHPAEIE